MSFLFRCATPCQRWLCDYGTVAGKRLPLKQMAKEIAEREGEKLGPIWISARCLNSWEIDVGTLKVFTSTATHGDWACNRTTQIMKRTLIQDFGADVPWYKM